MIRKLVIGNGRSEREILLVGNITIGRDPACHVSEPDPLLSRRHAEIIANVHGVSVRDLDSRNGILVNGEKTHEQVLLPGDVVQMGHLQLRYVEEQPRVAEPMPSRGVDPRRQAPPPPAPAYDIDRFRHEPPSAPVRPSAQATPQPGRWRPEPTPLPGRRTTAPPPPPPPIQTLPPQPSSNAPRGRAAFDETQWAPHPGQASLDHTRVGSSHDTTLGRPVDPDQTMLAPAVPTREPSGINRWTTTHDPDATMLAADLPLFSSDSTMGPGDATFAAALSQLAHIATPGQERLAPSSSPGARLIANAELTITDASPGCAELLGVPDDTVIGDSLADVFLRSVRRAYADPGAVLNLSVASGPRGSITVTLTLEKSSGNE